MTSETRETEVSLVFGWRLPSKIRESRQARERLVAQTDEIAQQVNRASAVTNHTASRLERAATELMERHNQGMTDAAAALRRR